MIKSNVRRALSTITACIGAALSLLSTSARAQTEVYQIACGSGAYGTWGYDQYYSGGAAVGTTSAIATAAVMTLAPVSIYQHERYGTFTYTLPGLTAGKAYTLRLHFSEFEMSAAGARKFNVTVNGVQVLTNFDIFAAAGGANIANVQEFSTTANGSGQVVIQFTNGTASVPKVDGIELLTASTSITYQNACGSGSTGTWAYDQYYSGGSVLGTTNAINTSKVVNPAPAAVYQHERYGACTYTFLNLTVGGYYILRLHFAEFEVSSAGARQFNVSVNGVQVLTNFDIYAAAGGANIANVQEFCTTPNSAGQIVIQFSNGAAGSPKVDGIEILTTSGASCFPVANAYQFLYNMINAYGTGSTTRLAPSYIPTSAFNVNPAAVFIYDDAVACIALLQRGTATDLSYAQVIGNAFVYLQQHDPIGDGRIRNSYLTNPLVLADGSVNINDPGAWTGNNAWVGMALVQLFHATGNTTYLNAAISIGSWIVSTQWDTRGSGGYLMGYSATGNYLANETEHTNKATEHQCDCYSLFTMLASATGNSAWTTDANWALGLANAMWYAAGGYYYIGTLSDGVTIDGPSSDPTPEDIQCWTYLAGITGNPSSITWVQNTLQENVGGFSGVCFDTQDLWATPGVWFEGTAHIAAALYARNGAGDATAATAYINDIEYAQLNGANNNGLGIIAASINGLNGDGSPTYWPALHVGATGWFCLAALKGDPYKFAH